MPPGPYRATTCRGRELNFGSHTHFFDHTRIWRASSDEWSAQCRGHLRDSTNMKDNTYQTHTQSYQQGEYGMMIMAAKWYSGTLWAWSFLTFVLQVRINPKKISPRKPSRPGIEPGPAAWQALKLLPEPQRSYRYTTVGLIDIPINRLHLGKFGSLCKVDYFNIAMFSIG